VLHYEAGDMVDLGTCSRVQLGDLVAHTLDGERRLGIVLCRPRRAVIKLFWLDNGKVGRKYQEELRLISRAHKEKIEIQGAAN